MRYAITQWSNGSFAVVLDGTHAGGVIEKFMPAVLDSDSKAMVSLGVWHASLMVAKPVQRTASGWIGWEEPETLELRDRIILAVLTQFGCGQEVLDMPIKEGLSTTTQIILRTPGVRIDDRHKVLEIWESMRKLWSLRREKVDSQGTLRNLLTL